MEYVVEMKNITMDFPGIRANDDVSLSIKKGEIFALVGENGAGKSTLMNILYGILTPTKGEVIIKGKKVNAFDPKNTIAAGVGMVHQHFMLVPSFTVAQNIVMSKEPRKFGLFYDDKAAVEAVRALSDEYGLFVEPNDTVREISVGLQQRVEILKTLYRGADVLILDEPTAVLTPQETDELFDILRRMRDDGKAIIIITHKLHEVLDLSDKVAVLRHGEYVGTINTREADENILTEMMVGKKVELNIERPEPVNPQDRLVVEHIDCKNRDGIKLLDDVSFTVRSGEILGIAGIAGSGQRELLEAIAGLQKLDGGSIIYHNPKNGKSENLRDKTPLEIRELGVRLSFVPEDRLGMGLVGNMSVVDNMMLRSYRKGKSVFVDKHGPEELAQKIIKDLEVATPDAETPVRRLSGGNVQKILLGREISSSPTLLMAAYPVRGLDINSSYLIYDLLNDQKRKGVAVIFVGEDLDVLIDLCDRIMVIGSGKITGILDGRSATKNEVGYLMTKADREENTDAE